MWRRNNLSLEFGLMLVAVSRKEVRAKKLFRLLLPCLVKEATWSRRRRLTKYVLESLSRLYLGTEDIRTAMRRLSLVYVGKK
jgi:hypothetical protein